MRWGVLSLCSSFLIAALTGCIEDSQKDDIALLDSGSYSGIRSRNLVVIDNHTQFVDLWLSHTANITPLPEIPDVDFGQRTVIGAFMGEKNAGGYDIHVDSIERNNDDALINIILTSPGPDCIIAVTITSPYEIVSVPKIKGTAIFSETAQTSDCKETVN